MTAGERLFRKAGLHDKENLSPSSCSPVHLLTCSIRLWRIDPETIRTSDLSLRRAALYPAELRGHAGCVGRVEAR